MNNIDILQTKYLQDLIDQKQIMEDALKYQGATVQDGEGFSTMVPKVQNVTKTKVWLPFISFNDCNLKTLPDINFNVFEPDCLKDVFNNALSYGTNQELPLDLSNINFRPVKDFSKMFSTIPKTGNIVQFIKLGSTFNLSNAESLSRMFGYGSDSSPSSSRYLYTILFGLDEVPECSAPNLKDVSHFVRDNSNKFTFMAGGGEGSFLPLELLLKIYDAKIENVSYLFFSSVGAPSLSNEGILQRVLEHMLNNWDLTNLKSMYAMFRGNYIGSTTPYVFDWLATIPVHNVEDISYLLYYGSANSSQKYGAELNLSNQSFDSLKKATYAFHFVGCDKINAGSAPNGTLTDISYCFAAGVNDNTDVGSLRELDFKNWDLSRVTTLNNLFYRRVNLETLYFGKDLGKGYTTTSSNASSCTIYLNDSKSLSTESVLDMFTKLYDLNLTYDVANGGTLKTQKVDLHADVIAKLTPEQIAIATNKGWTVS